MESLKIRTGAISLQIVDDFGNEKGVFTFNPNDIAVARKMLSFQDSIKAKEAEIKERAKKCGTDLEQVDLVIELVDFAESILDNCFGEGTSKLLFGETKTLSMLDDFIGGITPYYKKASEERIAKYSKKPSKPTKKK